LWTGGMVMCSWVGTCLLHVPCLQEQTVDRACAQPGVSFLPLITSLSDLSRSSDYMDPLVVAQVENKIEVNWGKVIPCTFYLTEHHAMEAYWGVEV
jgi:hypothetical protein